MHWLLLKRMEDGTVCTLGKHADDNKLGGIAETLEDRIRIINNLDKLKKMA